MSLFILTFETSRFASNLRVVEGMLSTHREVDAWSTPFAGCFFIKTKAELEPFSRSLDAFFSNKNFLVSEIGKENYKTNGRVAQAVWDFLKTE